MNLIHFLRERCQIITDPGTGIEKRLLVLSEIANYVSGMLHPAEYLCATINVLFEVCSKDVDIPLIRQYINELCAVLNYSETQEAVIILSEESSIAKSIRNLYSEKYLFVTIQTVNPSTPYLYDYGFLCGETDPFSSLGASFLQKVNILNLYLVCLTGFVGYPNTWTIYEKYMSTLQNSSTLITGMSYIRNALVPELLNGKVCSIANSSQDLYYDYLFFQDALKRNPRLNTLIIGLAPYSLRFDLSLTQTPVEQTRLYYYCARFKDFHNNTYLSDDLITYMNLLNNLEIILGTDFEINIYREYRNLQADTDDHSKNIFSPARMIEEEHMQMNGKYNKPYDETLYENKQILDDYLSLAKSKNMKIIIFIPPYSEWYRKRWNPAYRAELLDHLNLLQAKYPFTFLDLSDKELSNEYFEDYAHVNSLGAIYIASEINQHL